jgi:hypothetical protein
MKPSAMVVARARQHCCDPYNSCIDAVATRLDGDSETAGTELQNPAVGQDRVIKGQD